MSGSSLVKGAAHPSSCWHSMAKSKWTDAALITGFVALLIIGILASTGVFLSIGITNTAFLSYGMYGGAALFLLVEAVNKCLLIYSKKPQRAQPSSTVSPDTVAMRERVKAFAHKSNDYKEALAYILAVGEEPRFQQDPSLYIDNWISDKGGLPQSPSDPGDCALLFWIEERTRYFR
jgi:hypothetical protein